MANVNCYIIRTSFNYQKEFIFLDNLSVEDFLNECKFSCNYYYTFPIFVIYFHMLCFLGGKVFRINFDCEYNIELYDQNRTVIRRSEFTKIVELYYRSASFMILLVATPKTESECSQYM